METKILKDQYALSSTQVESCLQEDPIYPVEFLNTIKDTAFQALQDYLQLSNAPKETMDLLEDISVLTSWSGEVKKGGSVKSYVNQFLSEAVANASRNIVAIGGVFYAPSGTTIRRERGDNC